MINEVQITTHKLNGLNDAIEVIALGEPAADGAHHEYIIRGIRGPEDHHPIPTHAIIFQNGSIPEVGFNGITNEALLAVLMHRMAAFRDGPFPCRENSLAFTHLELAMFYLHSRTRQRLARGVEGTHQK